MYKKQVARIISCICWCFVFFFLLFNDDNHFVFLLNFGEVLIVSCIIWRSNIWKKPSIEIIWLQILLMIEKSVLEVLPEMDKRIILVFPIHLSILLYLLIVNWLFHERKHGDGILFVIVTFISSCFMFFYRKIEVLFYDYYLLWLNNNRNVSVIGKILLICSFLIANIIIVIIIMQFVQKLDCKFAIRISDICEKYPEIDFSAILISILSYIIMILTELLTYTAYDVDYALPLLWIIMCLLFVAIQAIYIRLLIKSITIKERMRIQKNDWENLKNYNMDLESNLEELREIRHDVKNLFLTMGGYVYQSKNKEMINFFTENIEPFVHQEIQKNEIYSQLSAISDESLKSFLYFKVMEIINKNICVDVIICLENRNLNFGIAQIDLIRILGIFIDNAMEEAQCCKGKILFQIRENNDEYIVWVQNSVREQIHRRGVIKGSTDKGIGRGNGLIIVDKIIRKYNNIILNSFFKESDFVQCLKIMK